MDRVLRLSWLRAEVSDCYAAPGVGRPGIGPEAALRLMLAGFLLGIVDDRRLLRQAQVDLAIRWFVRRDDTARRLATIPGIGPITASLIAATTQTFGFATVADIGVFPSARHFAARLGLVPRQHSTGGKTRLGWIAMAGNREIRRLLVLGATSMVRRAAGWNSAADAWARGGLERRPARLATVALANKMARIALRERPSAFPPLWGRPQTFRVSAGSLRDGGDDAQRDLPCELPSR